MSDEAKPRLYDPSPDPYLGDLDYDLEGDCPDCHGMGVVACNCDDRGCSQCIDCERECRGCGGSGFLCRFDDED